MPTPANRHPQDAAEPLGAVDPAGTPRARSRGHEVGDAKDLRPIGKARLKALREAIRNGTYPSNEFVEQGLLTMFMRPASRRPRG